MSKTIPATHDIRAVDFDDVKTFFEEIEKDTNLLHADELKFARNFLGKFGATIPPFKEEEDDDDDDDDVFPLFFTSRIVCKSRRPPVRSIERRASSKSSRPTCFFSLERNDKRTTPRAICRRRACFRARADIGRRWSKRLRPASKGILHFRDTGLFKILNRKSVASSLEGAHFSQRPSFLSPRDEKKQVR